MPGAFRLCCLTQAVLVFQCQYLQYHHQKLVQLWFQAGHRLSALVAQRLLLALVIRQHDRLLVLALE